MFVATIAEVLLHAPINPPKETVKLPVKRRRADHASLPRNYPFSVPAFYALVVRCLVGKIRCFCKLKPWKGPDINVHILYVYIDIYIYFYIYNYIHMYWFIYFLLIYFPRSSQMKYITYNIYTYLCTIISYNLKFASPHAPQFLSRWHNPHTPNDGQFVKPSEEVWWRSRAWLCRSIRSASKAGKGFEVSILTFCFFLPDFLGINFGIWGYLLGEGMANQKANNIFQYLID